MSGRYSLAVGRAGTEQFRDVAHRLVKHQAPALEATYAPRYVVVIVDRETVTVRTAPANTLGELASQVAILYALLDQHVVPLERALEPHECGTFEAALSALMDLGAVATAGHA